MDVQALSPETIQDTILPPTSQSSSNIFVVPSALIDTTFKTSTTDLVSAGLGGRILSFSDEFFADASNLINPAPPIQRKGVFVATGAWYDGWETRRHNREESDYVVVKMGVASGVVQGIEVDTAFFNGNQAPAVSVEGTYVAGEEQEEIDKKVADEAYGGWEPILSVQECGPSQRQAWSLKENEKRKPYTHVRLRMYPDGGIARFRVYGQALPVLPSSLDTVIELSAAQNGGVAVSWSDQHFGTAANLLLPGRGKDMGDGWETKRSRSKGHVDWAIIRLGLPGTIERIVADTMHFRGNFPRGVRAEGISVEEGEGEPAADDERWIEIMKETEGQKDAELEADADEEMRKLWGSRAWTHVKLIMIPDGGVKRFRVYGKRKG